MDEEKLVADLKTVFPQRPEVAEGPGDDCAVIHLPDSELLLLAAVDQVVESVHFLPGEPPERIAAKLVKRNVSDIAAMGGSPAYAMLTAAMNPLSPEFLAEFHRGVQKACEKYGMCVVGGDVSSLPSPGSVFTLSIFGYSAPGTVKLRRTARPGDLLCGTGCYGRSFETEHHLDFEPRLREGQFLGQCKAVHAMMDVSDGLLKDARRMALDSGLALEFDCASIPLRDGATTEDALCDGEDYELICAVAPNAAETLHSAFPHLTPMGKFTRGIPGNISGLPVLTKKGFDHFHETV